MFSLFKFDKVEHDDDHDVIDLCQHLHHFEKQLLFDDEVDEHDDGVQVAIVVVCIEEDDEMVEVLDDNQIINM